ncbi:hypothetical protein D9757_003122 [Collybiopsis confluens]|uniref:Zn(2)-C6 fungal-type domain-containing protein n=1 Tax=Collybiopsis confluens TaxID=2823264 RepID=A0A8H5HXD3_9AGAR|nr:hypothetical protein D9757_003122 [Collybiopsis confluens]
MSYANSRQQSYHDLDDSTAYKHYSTIANASPGYRLKPISRTAVNIYLPQYFSPEIYHRSHLNMDMSWAPYPQDIQPDYASDAANSNYNHTDKPYPYHHFSTPAVHPATQSVHSGLSTSEHADTYHNTLAGSLDPATGVFYRTPEHPRLRTAQACEKCRTRKAKCSGEHPSCKRCLTRGLSCEYAKEGRVRGPNKSKAKFSPPAQSSSSNIPPRQSQSSPSSSGSETSRSNSSTAPPVPHRYVPPSILPPSMSSSLSPSSPRPVGPFETLKGRTSSAKSSDSVTEATHAKAVSIPYRTNAKGRPSTLELSGVSSLYSPTSAILGFSGSQADVESTLSSLTHIPLSQSYSDAGTSPSFPTSGELSERESSPRSATTSTSLSDVSSPSSATLAHSDVGEYISMPEFANERQGTPDFKDP